MTRALLLDLGNVLVGFDHGLTLARLEKATGVSAAALRPHAFGPLERDFDLGRVDAQTFFRTVEAAAGLPRLPDGVWIPAWRDIFFRDERALALLPRLARGVTPVLVSNTNALHWDGVLRVAPELPRLLPRRALSFEVGFAKPDRAHFEAALSLAGAEARDAVFADDRGEMVAAARELGIDAFEVTGPGDLEPGLLARQLLLPRLIEPADPLFAKGVEEFRAGRYFEAHEEWEALWMTSEGDAKLILQALIQIAAACVHLKRGNAAPGARLLRLADEKLNQLGRTFGEMNTDMLRKEIGRAQELLGMGAVPGEVAKGFRL